MEVTIKLHSVTITDQETGEIFAVKTVRTAKEVFEEVEEREKDALIDRLQEVAGEVYSK